MFLLGSLGFNLPLGKLRGAVALVDLLFLEVALMLHHGQLLQAAVDLPAQEGDAVGIEAGLAQALLVVLQDIQGPVGVAGLEELHGIFLGVEAGLAPLLEIDLLHRQHLLGEVGFLARSPGGFEIGRLGHPRRRQHVAGRFLMGSLGHRRWWLHFRHQHDFLEPGLLVRGQVVVIESPQHGAREGKVAAAEGSHAGVVGPGGRENLLVKLLGIDGAQNHLGFILHAVLGIKRGLRQFAGAHGLAGAQLHARLIEELAAVLGKRRLLHERPGFLMVRLGEGAGLAGGAQAKALVARLLHPGQLAVDGHGVEAEGGGQAACLR